MTTAPQRRGRKPRHTREQLVDAAVAVVEAEGFAALSMRSVARQLEVSPMTLYTYVESTEEVVSLVIDRLIEEAVRGIRWPRTWREVLRLLAKRLDALVTERPAMVEAFGRGLVHGGSSRVVAQKVIDLIIADGLTPDEAMRGYMGVHALVLGAAVIRSGSHEVPLMALVETLLDGIAPDEP